MTQGKSGFRVITGTKGMTGKINWSETYDISTNTHVVTIDGFQVMAGTHFGYTYYLGSNANRGYIAVNGTDIAVFQNEAGSHYVTPGRNSYSSVLAAGSYPAAPWSTGNIHGREDGSCSVTITLDAYGFEPSGKGGNGFHLEDSFTLELTKLPRSSAVGATDANIGATSMIAITKALGSYTHSIAFQFGELSGFLRADGSISGTEVKFAETSVAWSIPHAFYEQIPNAKTGVCTLTCKTYSDEKQIGTAQTGSFTVTAAESLCAPEVSGTVMDTNEAAVRLTGDSGKLIRYVSNALCTIAATAKNSAQIVQKSINGAPVEEDAVTIFHAESGSIVFAATDSRGYATTARVHAEMVDYIPLTANVTVQRTDPTSGNGVITVTGNFYNGSFGAADNTLSVQYQVNGGATVTVAAEKNGNSYRASTTVSGLDYGAAHEITVTVTDLLRSVSKSVTVKKGIPVFDWGEKDFAFHVPVTMISANGVYMNSMRLSGTCFLEIQTRFSSFGSGGARQSLFLFGYNNNVLVQGVIGVSSDGSVVWSGTAGVTVAAGTGGRITVTLPNIAYDQFVILSGEAFSV